jgi:DNA processing protein
MLIRDGATLVRHADDVVAALPQRAAPQRAAQADMLADIPPPPPEKRSLRETASLHQQILSQLGPSPVAEDQLIRDLSVPAGHVGPALIDLELDGKIRRQSGGLLSLGN